MQMYFWSHWYYCRDPGGGASSWHPNSWGPTSWDPTSEGPNFWVPKSECPNSCGLKHWAHTLGAHTLRAQTLGVGLSLESLLETKGCFCLSGIEENWPSPKSYRYVLKGALYVLKGPALAPPHPQEFGLQECGLRDCGPKGWGPKSLGHSILGPQTLDPKVWPPRVCPLIRTTPTHANIM